MKICPQDTTKMLGSINSNSGEWPQDFLCFSLTYYFSSEHKPLFIPLWLYFIKRHIWRVKMFHKTVHKTWNLFKLSEQSPKNSAEKSCFMIFDRKVTFNRSSALFDQTNKNQAVIETSRDSRIFSLPFRLIEPKHRLIENAIFRIYT